MKKVSLPIWRVLFCIAFLLIIAFGLRTALQIRKKIDATAFTFENVKAMKVNINYSYDEADTIAYDPAAPEGYSTANFNLAKGNVTMQDVYERSDLIVRAKATDDRSFAYSSILTKAMITEVYKGDQSLKSQGIYVYEYMFPDLMLMLSHNNGGDGYNIMNTGAEYYLFLNLRPMPDGYIYSEKDRKTFLLTNVHLGKYKVSVSEDMKVLVPPKETKDFTLPDYEQISDWDILPVRSEQIDFYLRHRKEALELLDIADG